jgi:single-stranded-DNA-specific exonuclease
MRWTFRAVNGAPIATLRDELKVSATLAELLVRLGLFSPKDARTFLDPRLAELRNPLQVNNLKKAVRRLIGAMRSDEKIVVFGDYDVDGVTSTTFLVSILNRFGIRPHYAVPLRLEEGYGLSQAALERVLRECTPQLLIAVDCGTNSVEEVAFLRAQGIDVIILDHHTSRLEIPEDCIVVNPHVYDAEDVPWKNLCSVGLVFKFVHGLIKMLREEGDELARQIDLKEYLDLVALGTIADLVPLVGENRILAKRGLDLLRETRRVGLNALFNIAGLQLGSEISPFDVSFRLGPRINASGRLANATEPIQLLLSDDWRACREAAQNLDDFNRERQEIERGITSEAEAMVEAHFTEDPGLVLYKPDWHPGVVGIVASRLSHKFFRPAIVLGAEGDLAKGSGRSIPVLNLVEVLTPCAEFLESWGGHPMAIGISFKPEHLEAFRKAFNQSITRNLSGSVPEPEIEIAAQITLRELGEDLLNELDRLGPFGQGNPEPVFALRNVVLRQAPVAFGQGHFRFFVDTPRGGRISGVAWKMGHRMPPCGEPIDFALRLNWNTWNDQKLAQINLVDWLPAGSGNF